MLCDVISRQLDGRSKTEVEELSLDGWHCSEISASDRQLLEGLTALEFLSMNNCGLASLTNFPRLPNLLKLDLNDNKITDGLQHLSGLPKLMQLGLAGNTIRTLTELDKLKKTPELLEVDLQRCPVTEVGGYRTHMFNTLESLAVLDGADEEGNVIQESDGGEEEEDLEDLLDAEDDDSELDDSSDSDSISFTKPSKRPLLEALDSSDNSEDSEADSPPAKRRK